MKWTGPRKWTECPHCFQLIFCEVGTYGAHECPDLIRARIDAELDAIIDVEFSTWDEDVKKFWRSKDVKFMQYLADEGKL